MSDLRDTMPLGDARTPRFINEPVNIEPMSEATFIDSGGLGEMHINNEIEEPAARRSKLLAGIAVALVFGAAGAYGISVMVSHQEAVADSNLPQPTAPSRTAALAPPAPVMAPATQPVPDTAMAPAAPDVVKPAPVTKEAAITNTPKVTALPRSEETAMTPRRPVQLLAPAPAVTPEPAPAPVQDQASAIPEPVSPTPPANSVAGNPPLNEQSVSPDVSLTPQPAPEAPAAAQPEPAPAPAEPVQ